MADQDEQPCILQKYFNNLWDYCPVKLHACVFIAKIKVIILKTPKDYWRFKTK